MSHPVKPGEGRSSDGKSGEGSLGHAVTVVGGGTGLATLLRGLKHDVGGLLHSLTAVVTMADDGGSSGRLRRALGVLPPGDVRSCMVALADDEALLARLFQYRFPGGEGLAGHSFGNLFLTALAGITGDFYQAVLTAESILSVRGRILPSTLTDVRLRGAGRSGRIYEGESAVGNSGERIAKLSLEPENPPAFVSAIEAVQNADLILLGPGSLYTSILPNLLIPGIRRAISESDARVALVLNLMTQPGETDTMDAIDHIEALRLHADVPLHDVLVERASPPRRSLSSYAETGSIPVVVDREKISALGLRVVEADLLDTDLIDAGPLVRHAPEKLRRAVQGLLSDANAVSSAATTAPPG